MPNGVPSLPEAKDGQQNMTEDESKMAADELAKRLRLLLDVSIAETGEEPTYSQIMAFLQTRGVSLSRSRWTYMVNGHRFVQDRALFEALAEYFEVEPAFLAGGADAPMPAKVAAQLDLVRSMRVAKVKSYAARTLGDISPEALQAITRFLDNESNEGTTARGSRTVITADGSGGK
ncbi:hypothetical protein GCM10022200_25570 [Microbacterium awajiense]|uniref:XRE family transcriptional regulator n=2 Tax=Microbacterium awajiense TaxID=415214 RepID=A0ABP7AU79_9MICO